VNNNFASLWFPIAFATVPVFVASSQTAVGAEAYTIRHKNMTRARIEARLQEDDSADPEFSHSTETVGYVFLGRAGPPGAGKDATIVAMGDSITFGIGDNLPSDNFQDGTLPPGSYPPVLTSLYSSQSGQDVLIANEGIPGDRSADGLVDVNKIVGAYPLADYFLLLYGANDAGFNVPGGAGLFPGQPGYLGSFKANMQQMIDIIRNAGKTPVLAKVLYQTNPAKDPLVRSYNQAINELVAQNNIPVTPPNFYDFFKTNTNRLSDGLHPNGAGYRSMAQLWRNALTPLFP
jgi:lysophospholipase L1-like esterase